MYLETSKRHCSLILTFKLATYVIYYRSLSQKKRLKLKTFNLEKITDFIASCNAKAQPEAIEDCLDCTKTFTHLLITLPYAKA
jgi:hypothetical protein